MDIEKETLEEQRENVSSSRQQQSGLLEPSEPLVEPLEQGADGEMINNGGSSVAKTITTATAAASSETTFSSKVQSGVRRQLSVKDMFSSNNSDNANNHQVKKAKLNGNGHHSLPTSSPSSSPLSQTKSSPLPSSTSTSSPPRTSSSQRRNHSTLNSFSLSKAKTMNRKDIPLFNSIPFSLPAFESSLSETEAMLLKLEIETFGKSWLKILSSEIRKDYFIKLKKFLKSEGLGDASSSNKIFPTPNDIYSWSRHTPLSKVKVVIIGQDPYHGVGQAHGLCFSVRPDVQPIPGSLRNIYTELSNEYPDFKPPKHGYLSSWAKSGVLMLNTSLTVRPHQAGSHAGKGWEEFTDAVIDAVDLFGGASFKNHSGNSSNGVVFLAWGAWAAKRVAKLDHNRHCILKSAHPSPLSAHRGFIGNGHFKKANDWLSEKYGEENTINWTKLDLPEPGEPAD